MDCSKVSKRFLNEFNRLVSDAHTIVITSHTSPDDDSIAAVLTMYRYLLQNWPDKKIRIIYSGEKIDRFSTFQNFNKVEFVDDLANQIKNVDLIIGLDGSQFSRYFKLVDKFQENFRGKSVCIDHHSSPIDKFTLSLVVPNASSTSELIYECFYKNQSIDKSLAEIFLLGILGDTGTFNYIKPNQLVVFDIVKKLIKISGVEIQEFKSRYNTLPKRVYTLIQIILQNTQFVTVKGWPDLMFSYLDRETRSDGNYNDEEISNASHAFMSEYLRMVSGYPWGFIVTSKANGDCSLSLRSLPGSVNVRSISERMGIGGGHDRAAGGTFKTTTEPLSSKDCVERVIEWMEKNECILS